VRQRDLPNENSPRNYPPPDEAGGFLVLLMRNPQPAFPMSTRKISLSRSLCERLQKLKEGGFLDAVADTVIKLNA
jgi:hypothetical protein